MSLTTEQEKIAYSDNSMFVSSGPGVGKSYTIAYAVEDKIKKGVSPENIFLFSFSRTATTEIREKIKQQIGQEKYSKMMISTIHSFAYRIISEHLPEFGIPRLEVKDDYFYISTMKTFNQKEYQQDKSGFVPKLKDDDFDELMRQINYFKAFNLDDSDLVGPGDNDEDNKYKGYFKHLYREVSKWMLAHGYYTFIDLLYFGYSKITSNPLIIEEYRRKIKYLFIDECQDTARIQIDYLDFILSPDTKIIAVGDLKQTLYRFNNADPFYLIEWAKKRSLQTLGLNTTFRYGKEISDVSFKVMDKMAIPEEHKEYTKTLSSNKSDVIYYRVVDTANEVKIVCDSIQEKMREGISPENCNILYRINRTSLEFQKELVKRHIPFFVSGSSFLFRTEIRLVTEIVNGLYAFSPSSFSYIAKTLSVGIDEETTNKVVYEFDKTIPEGQSKTVIDFIKFALNTPISGVGKVKIAGFKRLESYYSKIEDLVKIATSETPVFSSIADIIEIRSLKFMQGTNAEGEDYASERMGFIYYLDEVRADNDVESLEDFFNFLKLEFAGDSKEDKKGKVYLGTYHSAKGMTLPIVYMLLDNMFKTFGKNRSNMNPSGLEGNRDSLDLDELFVLFVGITRAKKELHLFNIGNPATDFLFEEITYSVEQEKKKLADRTDLQYNLSRLRARGIVYLPGPVEYLRESDKAIQITFGENGVTKWCPKGHIASDGDKIVVSRWIYQQWN